MEAVITILALLFFAFVALGVYVSVKAVRAAKRGVERTVTQARRTVEETALRAKSYGQTGVVGELAQLRLKLRTSMRATQDTLNAGVAEDASLSESLALFQRLSAHGRELDDELRRLEREPDRAKVSSLMPGLRERTEQVTHSAEALRWAARDRAQKFAEGDLDALSAQIDMEAGALRHWSATDGSADADSRADAGLSGGEGNTGAGASAWPQAPDSEVSEPAGAGPGATQTWPTAPESEAGAEPEAQDRPQAITARDPRQPTTYPWQKTARPETTN
jgi:hypothetical protein